MALELLALLDRIEVEDDVTLATQRFEIAEKYGYEVVWGAECSAEHH